MRIFIDNFLERQLKSGVGKRVLKCEKNIFGWVKNLTSEQIDFNSPIVLCLGGAGINDDKSANGFAKISQCLLGRVGVKDNDVQILGVQYPENLNRLSLERKQFRCGKPREVAEYIYGIYYTVLRPVLFDKDDKVRDLDTIKSMLRNITLFSHCHGTFVACEIVNYLKNDMLAVGFSDDDVKICLSEIVNIMLSPREGVHMDSGSLKIGFTLASDNLEGGVAFPKKKNINIGVSDFCDKFLSNGIKGSDCMYLKYGYLHSFFDTDTFGADIKFVEDENGEFGRAYASEMVYDNIFIGQIFHLVYNYCFPLKKYEESDVGYIVKNEKGINFSNMIIRALQNSVSLSMMNKKRELENVVSNDTEIVFAKGDECENFYYRDVKFKGCVEEFSKNFYKGFNISKEKIMNVIESQVAR